MYHLFSKIFNYGRQCSNIRIQTDARTRGIIGVSVGVAGILTGMLNSGLESDILQKKDMMRPNEGIHRSARNAVLAAAVFGPLGGIICGVVCGISFGFIGHLTTWPLLTVCFALVFGILFGFYRSFGPRSHCLPSACVSSLFPLA
jgi:hypothetical protein